MKKQTLNFIKLTLGISIVFCITYLLYSKVTTTSPDSNAMIIVEPRKHKLLKHVCDNFHKNMDPSWDLYVFHGKNNRAFAELAVADIQGRRIVLVPLDVDNLPTKEYNKLFKEEQFWNKVNAENILVFQTDTALCPKSTYTIYDFIHYDYIGCSAFDGALGNSKNTWGKHETTGEILQFYGVGGLSFRKKSFMIQCIREKNWPDVYFAEDVFYSECVAKSKNRPLHPSALSTFCTQGNYKHNSFGAHNISWLPKEERKPFCTFCPEAALMLEK